MYETEQEVAELQRLLDRSFARSSAHVLEIMEPPRRLRAERLIAEIPSPAVLNIATVTARGEPRVSAVDGHFLHGRWHFTTAPDSRKAAHLTSRPALSASYTPRDGFGVFCHGTAVILEGPARRPFLEHLGATYGTEADDWAGVACFRIEQHWMTAFSLTAEELAQMEAHRAGHQDGAAPTG